MREALYYMRQGDGLVCQLCPKQCFIGEGQAGFCRVRRNKSGKLYTENYGACSSYALDPIEKKPLYHFYPGSYILSIGTWGCNFSCRFCQNWQIAQTEPETAAMSPEQAVKMALAAGPQNIGLAYTYSEPSVWYEYVLDTAKLARNKGLKNVLVTNGFINPEPLQELLPHIDALNIDVKAFTERFYKELCAGSLADVKRTVEVAAAIAHVEITCLVVPGQNDSAEEIDALTGWLAGISKDIPLHLSRYYPNYKLDIPATPVSTLLAAKDIAERYLNYVYIGNVGGEGVNTHCPVCSAKVIDRISGSRRLAADNKCPNCGNLLPIISTVNAETKE